ncbi:MAG TPA: hypothetical protein PLO61_08615 [Fimbriimonadaceae bacterium]|nr:hypothetical protein [Fimbriimonadaceae bacterium]HRJ33643.1 hypothetical protein [Fimbriimonadaceae bacterium]
MVWLRRVSKGCWQNVGHLRANETPFLAVELLDQLRTPGEIPYVTRVTSWEAISSLDAVLSNGLGRVVQIRGRIPSSTVGLDIGTLSKAAAIFDTELEDCMLKYAIETTEPVRLHGVGRDAQLFTSDIAAAWFTSQIDAPAIESARLLSPIHLCERVCGSATYAELVELFWKGRFDASLLYASPLCTELLSNTSSDSVTVIEGECDILEEDVNGEGDHVGLKFL